jgi:hypothetical protein
MATGWHQSGDLYHLMQTRPATEVSGFFSAKASAIHYLLTKNRNRQAET